MALPGLLVEYLVVGSMALLWFLPLVGISINGEIPLGKAAALAPAIYVLGMFIDFIAYILVSKLPVKKYSLKSLVHKFISNKPDIKNIENNIFRSGVGRSSRGTIWLHLNASDLVKEIESQSSRDRIARGALVNILIMWFLVNIELVTKVLPTVAMTNTHWFFLSLFSLFAWMFLEANIFGFELRAGQMVPEKEESTR